MREMRDEEYVDDDEWLEAEPEGKLGRLMALG